MCQKCNSFIVFFTLKKRMLPFKGTWLKLKGWTLSIGKENLLIRGQHPLMAFL